MEGGEPVDDRNFKKENRADEHTLTILNREHITIQGVLHVDSFDDQEIVLDTELGTLTIRGEDLHIKQFDLDTGNFSVDGCVNALQYSAPRGNKGAKGSRNRGLFERLLR